MIPGPDAVPLAFVGALVAIAMLFGGLFGGLIGAALRGRREDREEQRAATGQIVDAVLDLKIVVGALVSKQAPQRAPRVPIGFEEMRRPGGGRKVPEPPASVEPVYAAEDDEALVGELVYVVEVRDDGRPRC